MGILNNKDSIKKIVKIISTYAVILYNKKKKEIIPYNEIFLLKLLKSQLLYFSVVSFLSALLLKYVLNSYNFPKTVVDLAEKAKNFKEFPQPVIFPKES